MDGAGLRGTRTLDFSIDCIVRESTVMNGFSNGLAQELRQRFDFSRVVFRVGLFQWSLRYNLYGDS